MGTLTGPLHTLPLLSWLRSGPSCRLMGRFLSHLKPPHFSDLQVGSTIWYVCFFSLYRLEFPDSQSDHNRICNKSDELTFSIGRCSMFFDDRITANIMRNPKPVEERDMG